MWSELGLFFAGAIVGMTYVQYREQKQLQLALESERKRLAEVERRNADSVIREAYTMAWHHVLTMQSEATRVITALRYATEEYDDEREAARNFLDDIDNDIDNVRRSLEEMITTLNHDVRPEECNAVQYYGESMRKMSEYKGQIQAMLDK